MTKGFRTRSTNRGRSKTEFCCESFPRNCWSETRFRNSIFSIVTFSVVELWRVEEVLPPDVAAGDPHGLRDHLGGDHDLEWKTIEKDLKKTKKNVETVLQSKRIERRSCAIFADDVVDENKLSVFCDYRPKSKYTFVHHNTRVSGVVIVWPHKNNHIFEGNSAKFKVLGTLSKSTDDFLPLEERMGDSKRAKNAI